MSVKTLIDDAAKNLGTRYKVAKALHVTPAQVYDWEEGRKTCSPEDRARIAALANQDALQELVRGVLEKHEGTVRGDQLQKVLGKLLRQTGGALHSVAGIGVSLICSLTVIGWNDLTQCIEKLSNKRKRDSFKTLYINPVIYGVFC